MTNKYVLEESQIPTQWYNVIPDLPEPPPPALHPGTREPAGPEDFAPLFPMELIKQEVTQDSYVDIPGEVLDIYKLWRPTPLFRARRLEEALDTPARSFISTKELVQRVHINPTRQYPRRITTPKKGSEN